MNRSEILCVGEEVLRLQRRQNPLAPTVCSALFGGLRASFYPDLNPVEQVWNVSKYSTLANFVPNDISDLSDAMTVALTLQGAETGHLHGFFWRAGLFL